MIGLAILLSVLAVLLAPSWTAGLRRVGAAVAVAVLLGWFAVRMITDAVVKRPARPKDRRRWPT